MLSANYIVRHSSGDPKVGDSYCPVARRGGHFEIKTAYVELSDEIYLISPLTKFSFATCEQLNDLNEFTIDEKTQVEQAKKYPQKIKYREIELIDSESRKKCSFFITSREGKDLFSKFAASLKEELETSYGDTKVHIATDFKLEQCISVNRNNDAYRDIEIQREIPHRSLREAYLKMISTGSGEFIWDKSWIARPRELTPQEEYFNTLFGCDLR